MWILSSRIISTRDFKRESYEEVEEYTRIACVLCVQREEKKVKKKYEMGQSHSKQHQRRKKDKMTAF
jgi:hypothetical protein